jgi:hypothetical protein
MASDAKFFTRGKIQELRKVYTGLISIIVEMDTERRRAFKTGT